VFELETLLVKRGTVRARRAGAGPTHILAMRNRVKLGVTLVGAALVALIVVSDVVVAIPSSGDGRTVWAVLIGVVVLVVGAWPSTAEGGGDEAAGRHPNVR